jgi:UDPglucose--hexose-1-phosphate uridylyltransferase
VTLPEALRAHPHRRLNPLTREWVLVSPHRALRPWQGQTDAPAIGARQPYDPACYLCPGNARAGGQRNPAYTSTFVFDNDFPALYLDAPPAEVAEGGLLAARAEGGVCRVVCFSPDHSLTLSRMSDEAIGRVVDTWAAQFAELAALPAIGAVQIFENRGEMMGASNPHPHGQIWATETVPGELAKEVDGQRHYFEVRGRCLLCDYAALELERGERLVCRNAHFAAVAPFWAVWPFELLVLPLRHMAALDELAAPERAALAALLGRITRGYDRLFHAPFPYTMGFHQRPTRGAVPPYFHLHAHFYPPLLRSAAVRKFMVGFELLGNPQRDITPEAAAARLREAFAAG